MSDHGIGICAPLPNGDTLIHLAARSGHLQLIRFLADSGVPVDAKTYCLAPGRLRASPINEAIHIAAWRMWEAEVFATTESAILAAGVVRLHAVRLISTYASSPQQYEEFFTYRMCAFNWHINAAHVLENSSSHMSFHRCKQEIYHVLRQCSPLCHIDLLTTERARALLRAGFDLRQQAPKPNPTRPQTLFDQALSCSLLFAGQCLTDLSPLDHAQLLRQNVDMSPRCNRWGVRVWDVADLIVSAAGPWSVKSHEFFSETDRQQAVTLVHVLYHLYARLLAHGGWGALDFAHYILSMCFHR